MDHIRTSNDLLRLLRESRNPLPLGKTKSELINFVNFFNTQEKNSAEYKKFLSISRDLANELENFNEDDFYSLMSFFVLAHVGDYDTFLSFEKVKDKINNNDMEKQALFLKLLHTINKEGFSKLQINTYKNIKKKFPLFWADINFEIDICESLETLKGSNMVFSDIVQPLKKWLKSLDKENENHQFKIEKIQQFVENFNGESKEWLNENKNLFLQVKRTSPVLKGFRDRVESSLYLQIA